MSPWPPAGSVPTHRRGSVPVGRRTLRRLVAVTCAALVAIGALATPGLAESTDPPPRQTARLVVNGLEAVVGPADDGTVPDGEQDTRPPSTLTARVLVQNLTDQPLAGLRLVATVHERVTTPSALRAALEPGSSRLGDVVAIGLDEPLDPLPPGGFAQIDLALDAEANGLVDDEDVTIHPVRIAVAQAVSVLDEVRTAAVGVARPIARPLETVLLAPLDGPVTDPAPHLLPGGRLDRLLRAVETAPVGTVTVAPAAHTVEDLADLAEASVPGAADVADRLAAVVADRAAGAVSSPYALADVPALAATEATEDLAAAAIVAGRQRLPALLGSAPAAAHLLVSTQSPASADLAPADVLLTTWDGTSGPDLEANPSADVPPALRTGRSAAGRGLTVLVGDPWITEVLATASGAHGWAVDAHRAVVESAMLFARAPGREGRALAVVPPVGWEAPGRLADEVYGRLAVAPWLRPGDPVTVAARGEVTAAWQGTAPVEPARTALLGRVAGLEDRLAGLTAAVAESQEPPTVVTRTDELLRAMSVWPTDTPLERASAVLTDLETAVDAAIGEVVVPDDSVVTLASERGVIPVTVQHPEGVPLDVLVEVAAQGRLTFTEGTSRPVRLDEGGTATVSFEATALGRGTFPLEVTVRTPSGNVVLARTLLSVRTSAVSRPALLAVGGVLLVLLVLGRLRRPQRRHLEVVR